MLNVIQIVNKVFSSNTYIVFDADYNYCWLVDIGDFQRVANVLPDGVSVRGVFLTHSHFDHIYGANSLYQAFPHCRVYTSAYGRDALYNEKKNFSVYHETPFVYKGGEVSILGEESEIELYPAVIMTAYATPGHCPSCLTYSVSNWLFTGDSFIPGTKVVTKLPKGDRHQAQESEKRIVQLSANKIICPGHGDLIRY